MKNIRGSEHSFFALHDSQYHVASIRIRIMSSLVLFDYLIFALMSMASEYYIWICHFGPWRFLVRT